MPNIVKMRIDDGAQVDVYEVPFQTVRDDWNIYRLENGREVRMKVMVARICQVVDSEGKDQYLPDGSPYLVVNQRVEIIASL